MVYCKYIYYHITIHTKFAGPMQNLNIKSLTMLAFLFELRVMLLLTRVYPHHVHMQCYSKLHPIYPMLIFSWIGLIRRTGLPHCLQWLYMCNSVAHTSIRERFICIGRAEVDCSQLGRRAMKRLVSLDSQLSLHIIRFDSLEKHDWRHSNPISPR